MFRKLTLCCSVLLASTAVLACGNAGEDQSAQSEDDVVTGKSVLSGKTRSFSGTFALEVQGHAIRMSFDVSKIDWSAGTAVFDSKIIDSGGLAELTEDKAVATRIAIARCPGCYSFDAKVGAETLLQIDFAETKLRSLTYSGFATTAIVTKVSEAESGGGSCSLVCGSTLECKSVASGSDCIADSFDAIPRCPYTLEFKAGATCAP